jgi:hypothetical protein
VNKQDEKEVLRMVYKEEDYPIEDDDCEKPDFILKDKSGITFGVEVTEYFNSESAARLVKVPNYTDRLLSDDIPDENKYIHKKDKKVLKLDMLTFYNEDGSEKFEAKGIIEENQPRAQYLDSIVSTIQTKNEKGKSYNTTIAHTDLVIFDRSGSFGLDELEYFYEAFYTPSIISVLQDSMFKEISIIISHKEDKYFFRLKEYLMLSRIYLFMFFYDEYEKGVKMKGTILQFIIDMLYCLDKNGFKDVGVNFNMEEKRFEVFYGGTGFEILENLQVNLNVKRYNFSQTPQHPNIPDFLQYVQTLPDESLYQSYSDYLKVKAFRCDCAILCNK